MCIKRRILTEYVVLDIETTGFNPQKHKIIEMAVCKVKDGDIIDKFTTLVNPKQPIHKSITEITHITNHMINRADTIDIVMPKFLEFIGQLPIVVHNSKYVIEFLKNECANLNLSLDNPVIDTLPLCKEKLPKLRLYTIKSISKFLENDKVEINSLMDYVRFTIKVFEYVR